ncbi:MAG: PIN domain-containing protein [Minisyncoccales bacterium]
MKYFLDTYALIEIIKGNKNYKKFLNKKFATSLYNLYELYFLLLKDFGEDKAKSYFYQFKDFILPMKDEYIFNASKFKLKKIKNKLSYADCLGYIMAIENNYMFLTGDKEFKKIKGVEFVK